MAALITMIRTYWIIITLILLAVITLLSLTPLPSFPGIPSNDKIRHFIAYAALTFPVVLSRPRHWFLIGLFFSVGAAALRCCSLTFITSGIGWICSSMLLASAVVFSVLYC